MKRVLTLLSLAVLALGIGFGILRIIPSASPIEDQPVSYWREQIREQGASSAHRKMVDGVAALADNDQHLTAHKFGSALYEELGLEGVDICDHVYGQGCFHQYFMTSLLDRGESVVRDFSEACHKKLHGGDNIRACNHGLGHGVMVAFEDRGLVGALDACATLAENQAFLGCIDGVFMEYFTPTHTGRNTEQIPVRIFDESKPYEPCLSLDKKFQPTCYYMLSSWWVFKAITYEDAATLCRNIPGNYTRACFASLGHVIGIASEFSKDKALAQCTSLSRSEQEEISCRAGAHFAFSRAGEVGINLSESERALCEFNSVDTKRRCLEQSDMIYTPIGISVICCHQKL